MTPEQAEEIYHAECTKIFQRHHFDYKPVNQREGILAGYQAIIDAVTREIDNEYALKLIAMAATNAPQFVGTKPQFVLKPDAGDSGERDASA